MPAARHANYSRSGLLSDATVRCAVIGFVSGLISSVSLITTLHSLWLGISLGVLFGAVYALAGERISFGYAENVFTAAALVIPVWATFSLIVFPTFTGAGPQWSAEGIRTLFPQFVGWLLYGATLGLTVQALRDVSSKVLAPEAIAATIPPSTTKVVILGGGFAGMATAQYLEREFGPDRSVSITLISETNALLFTPMLAEVAGSSVEPSHISSPLRTSLHRTHFVRARVTGVDFGSRRVMLNSSAGQDDSIPYDHLVFALGSVSNYFGNDNIRSSSFSFKTMLDAIRIRNHIIEMFERADRETNAIIRRELLTFVVAGGGFAGVELAGALNDFARGILADYPNLRPEEVNVTLVHSRTAILPELSQTLSEYARRSMESRGVRFELGHRIVDAHQGLVVLDNCEIPTRTLVWTAGTVPNPLISEVGLETDKRGAARVGATLAIARHPGVWAVGDCAAVPDSKTNNLCPPTAQFALRQARALARNIKAVISGGHESRLDPFHFNSLGSLCVVGHHTACAELNLPWPVHKTMRFSGLLAWLMWRGIYLSKLPGLERRIRVLVDWAIELFFPRDIVQTIDLHDGDLG